MNIKAEMIEVVSNYGNLAKIQSNWYINFIPQPI